MLFCLQPFSRIYENLIFIYGFPRPELERQEDGIISLTCVSSLSRYPAIVGGICLSICSEGASIDGSGSVWSKVSEGSCSS